MPGFVVSHVQFSVRTAWAVRLMAVVSFSNRPSAAYELLIHVLIRHPGVVYVKAVLHPPKQTSFRHFSDEICFDWVNTYLSLHWIWLSAFGCLLMYGMGTFSSCLILINDHLVVTACMRIIIRLWHLKMAQGQISFEFIGTQWQEFVISY